MIADTGEDLIVYNPDSDYAANIELAAAPCLIPERAAPQETLQKVATPNAPKCELVAEQLNRPLADTVKSIVLATDPAEEGASVRIWLLLLRGDHELNEVKVSKLPGLEAGYRFATEEEIVDHFGCVPGYLGPVNTRKPVNIIADLTVANMNDFICGANDEGYHYTGINWERDLPAVESFDLRNVVDGEPDPNGGTLRINAALKLGTFSSLTNTHAPSTPRSWIPMVNPPSCRWAAMALGSVASRLRRSSRTMMKKASSGREQSHHLK